MGRSPRGGHGNPLQYSCLENPHGQRSLVGCSPWGRSSQTRLSDLTFTFHFHALEKEMATHSSVLAWRIPGIGEPGGLLSMRSHRVGHDWSNLAVAANLGYLKWKTDNIYMRFILCKNTIRICNIHDSSRTIEDMQEKRKREKTYMVKSLNKTTMKIP